MKSIIEDIRRPEESTLKKFKGMQAALLHEAMGKRGALQNGIKPIYPGAAFYGTALTVKGYPGDNLMLHKAVSMAQPGDVLVATVNEFCEAGHWGEIITVAAMEKGIRGLVIDGGVRDTEPISKLGFPVFAKALSIKGTTKKQAGLINHSICIGGAVVNPGDIVVGDVDGVVVVPVEEAEAVLEAAAKLEERENGIMAEIKMGRLTLDLLNLRPVLKELGLEE